MLYLSKESPISSLLAGTLNPIKHSPAVLIHFAYPLRLITYKNRWELQTSVYLLKEKNHQQRNHQNIKNTRTTRETTQTEERANLECPDKEIKETTPLNPIEFLPQNFTLQRELAKQNFRKHRSREKESPKLGRQKTT